MSIYSTEVTDKNKKLEYYETVFPRVNEFYENNYKTVEINKEKANKYDSLVEKIKEKISELDKKEQEAYSDASISYTLCDIEIRRSTLKELLEEGEKE